MTRRNAGGFTLFEILAVVIVIGILVAALLPQFGWIRNESPAKQSALELADTIELMRDEAALQGRNFGLRFEPDGYVILDLDPDSGAWLTISDDDFLEPVVLPDDIVMELYIEDREIELEATPEDEGEEQLDAFGNPMETAEQPPQVVVLTSGEMTPFQLRLDQFGNDEFLQLNADAFGELELLTELP
ncbi:MAG: type II secretion system minor pseudopilin GspH [Pseudomonadota bacterium]